MKTFVFPYIVSAGKLDSAESEVEVSLSDKNAKRLERSAFWGGRFRLHEDDDLADIYDKVHQAAYNQELALLKQNPELVVATFDLDETFEREGCIPNEYFAHYLDRLLIEVNYPEELQLLERTITKRSKQSHCEQVTIDAAELQEYLKLPEHQQQIIYTDHGETLSFVPVDFSGTFTLPAAVRKIEKGTFKKHKKITKFIAEDGIEIIPEYAFEGCGSLKHILLPTSVKRIKEWAFQDCEELAQIDLSEGLLEIHNTAFRCCYALETLHLPASLQVFSPLICVWNAIDTLVFEGMNTQIENVSDIRGKRIRAYPGSAVDEYARTHQCYRYKPLP